MATYVPDSNLEDKFKYNPTREVPRVIFNSGYPINEEKMNRTQRVMQDAVLNNHRSMIKYPGIVRVQP